MPGIALEDVIMRAGDRQVRELLGVAASRLINVFEPDFAGTDRLRKLVLELRDPVSLLSDPIAWSIIVDLLPYEKAVSLGDQLGISDPRSLYDELRSLQFATEIPSRKMLWRRFFGVLEEDHAPITPMPVQKDVNPQYPLFSYQRRAAESVLEHLGRGKRRCVLHFPTGAGKTRTSMHVVCEWLRRTPGTTVVWLARSSELLEQAASEFERAWSALGDRPMPLYRFWGNRSPELADDLDGFVVGGLGKLQSMLTERARVGNSVLFSLANRTSLVVFDEAHQAIASTYRKLTDFLLTQRQGTSLLGLTATPGRTWDNPEADEKLVDYFASTKVMIEIEGYADPVAYLVDQGYLARAHFISLNSSATIDLTEADRQELMENCDIPFSVLARLAEDEQRNLRIVHAVEELERRHPRIILFAATVPHAQLLAAVLRARGIDADAVDGKTAASERERIIRKFRGNLAHPIVLCNFGVLTTGFDAPATSAAVIARPTRSLVLYSQMVGRATRGWLVGGNKDAEIVTVVDPGLFGFGSVGEAFRNWEDVW